MTGVLFATVLGFHPIPSVTWRGVHLFVGPNALPFHQKLWSKVLLPLGFNRVVLQCEQTEWACLPNMRGGLNMKRQDLKKLCVWYREQGVEVIPLVQSLGHTQWLCQGGKNRDLMMSREVPFTVDSRKPEVRKLFAKLWSEVIAVTGAKTVHFGMDEIAFRGMPKDAKLVTTLWKSQMPVLTKIARQHRVNVMVWGDQLLGPGEGALPCGGGTLEDARARRATLPKGTYVCDWHYQNSSDSDLYLKSLNLFKKEGFRPIAAAWYRPKNIAGQVEAAKRGPFGLLQTTWAGYESSDAVMRKNLRQYAAPILAADALAGRTRQTDAEQTLMRLYDR